MTTHRRGLFFLWSSKPSFNFYLIIILSSNAAELAAIFKMKTSTENRRSILSTFVMSCEQNIRADRYLWDFPAHWDASLRMHRSRLIICIVWNWQFDLLSNLLILSSEGKLTVVFVSGKSLSYLDSSQIQGFGHLCYPGLFITDCFLWFWLCFKNTGLWELMKLYCNKELLILAAWSLKLET